MSRARSLLRAEYLLPIACLLAAACVAAAEFSTVFEFDRGTSGDSVAKIEAIDRHHYALLVLAVFAVVAVAVAVAAGSRPAAAAVAIAGGLSLLIFLLVDLPDVNQKGSLDDATVEFLSSKAEPADGFWLELVGTVSLALAGGALATLRSDQLQMLVPARHRGERQPGPRRGKPQSRRSAEPRKLGARAAHDGAKGPDKGREDDAEPGKRAAHAAARRRGSQRGSGPPGYQR